MGVYLGYWWLDGGFNITIRCKVCFWWKKQLVTKVTSDYFYSGNILKTGREWACFALIFVIEVEWTDYVWEVLWVRFFRDLLGRLQTWFEPSVAFIPKGFKLLNLCIQKISHSSLQARVSRDLGSWLVNSKMLICMTVAWYPG